MWRSIWTKQTFEQLHEVMVRDLAHLARLSYREQKIQFLVFGFYYIPATVDMEPIWPPTASPQKKRLEDRRGARAVS